MDRLACVDLPAFPLQLLLRRRPEWAGYPAAVIAEDKPQAVILWVNEKARRAGVLPGLRYAAGSSLAPHLRAGAVPSAEIKKEVAELTRRLMRFTPEVEPSEEEPGVFWLSGIGLNLLYPSLKEWAHVIHADVEARGFRAGVVVGFTRFGTYAVAKAEQGTVVFENPSEERAAAGKVPLDYLDLEPNFRDALLKLGIKTVGALISLPAGGLRERFGVKAHRLYRMAAGDLWTPLDPYKTEEPVRQKLILDDPEGDAERLIFLMKRLLHPMLATLAARTQALAALWFSFLIDKPCKNLPSALRLGSEPVLSLSKERTAQPLNHDVLHPVRGELGRTMNGIFAQSVDQSSWLKEQVRPAAPTLDSVQVLDLVRLRLETVELSAGVVEIELVAAGNPATAEQLRLFALSGVEGPQRDLDAANRALARLRAEFGDEVVVRAKLASGHLPEARFVWEPLERVELPRPERVSTRTLVRRILARSTSLPPQPRTHDDGWLLLGPRYGAVERLSGPYVFSGGWWNREIHREYYFAETRRGDLLWVYYDRPRRRWFLQGWIE